MPNFSPSLILNVAISLVIVIEHLVTSILNFICLSDEKSTSLSFPCQPVTHQELKPFFFCEFIDSDLILLQIFLH